MIALSDTSSQVKELTEALHSTGKSFSMSHSHIEASETGNSLSQFRVVPPIESLELHSRIQVICSHCDTGRRTTMLKGSGMMAR